VQLEFLEGMWDIPRVCDAEKGVHFIGLYKLKQNKRMLVGIVVGLFKP
jgi:hypothetical protein